MLEQSVSGDQDRAPVESDLRAGDGLFQRLLDRLPAGAYMCDPDGLITYFNEHAVQLWGRAPRLRDPVDRFCGSFRLFTSEGVALKRDRCWMALALEQQQGYNGEEIIVERPDGSRLTALAHANPIYDDAGVLAGAVNVLVDISGQKRIETALAEADEAKSEFLATVSHEIRTPINAILGYLDLLDLELHGPLNERQRSHLSRVQSASGHLLSLINQVLDVSRLDAEQVVVRQDRLRAADTADAALSVVYPLAAARGVALRNSGAAGAPDRYVGDEDRVRQMLINLLSNAIKFSEPGGVVEIAWDIGGRPDIAPTLDESPTRWLRFRVSDRAGGIPAEQFSRIFEPFVQLESSRTRTRGGTGLGLTIARRLAREMGGDLSVESTVGEGSTFALWLPGTEEESAGHPTGSAPAPDPEPVLADAFAVAGNLLLGRLDRLLEDYVERIRAESLGPGAASLPVSRIADHAAMIITHLAVGLRSIQFAAEDSTLPDPSSSEILRVCATEHGKQRASFGWDENAVSREFDIIADELIRHLRGTRDHADLPPEVVRVLRCRIEQARTISLQALQSTA